MIPTLCFQIIKKLIERKQSQIRKVYPGLTCFKEGVRQIPVESIPGISESFSADELKTQMSHIFFFSMREKYFFPPFRGDGVETH